MKKRILFVDDEPRILEGLQNRLRRNRRIWDMHFVESGRAALEALAKDKFDVIVSDMRMPEMDGATLLKRVHEEYPEVVRIVFSGYSELETTMRAVQVAHQFLTKPCKVELIKNAIERACNLQSLCNDEIIRRTISKIDKLPSMPHMYSRLMSALSNENVSIRHISSILKQDMAMCAKMLQIVNSAFFRLARKITDVEEAVTYLGFNTIKQLALAVEIFDQGDTRVRGLSIEQLQRHAMLTGSIAVGLFKDLQQREDAFTAGMLHDIGKLIVAREMPEHLDRIRDLLQTKGGSMYSAEEELLGVTHAEIGGYLMGIWGLPYSIVEAVANHHAPGRVEYMEEPTFDILAAVHVADALASELAPQSLGDLQYEGSALDMGYLERLGVAGQIDAWREMARPKAAVA